VLLLLFCIIVTSCYGCHCGHGCLLRSFLSLLLHFCPGSLLCCHCQLLLHCHCAGSSVLKSSPIRFFYLETKQLATATGLYLSRYQGTVTGPLRMGPNRSTTQKKSV
jgi:hypothetical protein